VSAYNRRMTAFLVVIWTCVGLFVVTSIILILALVGRVKLGGGDGNRHDFYLRALFTVLIVEIATAGAGAFTVYLKTAPSSLNGVNTTSTGTGASTPSTNTHASTDTIGTGTAARTTSTSSSATVSDAEPNVPNTFVAEWAGGGYTDRNADGLITHQYDIHTQVPTSDSVVFNVAVPIKGLYTAIAAWAPSRPPRGPVFMYVNCNHPTCHEVLSASVSNDSNDNVETQDLGKVHLNKGMNRLILFTKATYMPHIKSLTVKRDT
jgi:hypothetical protein